MQSIEGELTEVVFKSRCVPRIGPIRDLLNVYRLLETNWENPLGRLRKR